MSDLTYGELFAGYDGLGMGVRSVLGGETSWFCEFDKAPSKILAHHNPGVPNYGDVTKVDWATVPKVDVITGGSPCQDLSHAGKRKGMTDGTRSNLWVQMREAIATIRPRLVVWENVRGALSANAASDVEPCPGCMGGADDGGPALRALGRVAGDLADIGYDSRWYGLRAADVGGAHGRFRIFLFAQPADADVSGLEGLADQAGAAQAERRGHAESGTVGSDLILLPTPACNDMGAAYTPETWDAWTAKLKADHGNGNGHGKSLAIEAQRLLPTPRATDGTKGGPNQRGSSGDLMLPSAVHLLPTPSAADGNDGGRFSSAGHQKTLPGEARLLPTPTVGDSKSARNSTANRRVLPPTGIHAGDTLTDVTVGQSQDWREYAAAITRAEHATGRTAPPPTEPGAKGNPRLSPAFVEWLMMLPAGHVTDPAIGLTRNEQLKALGNGVVPPQAAAATRAFLADTLGTRPEPAPAPHDGALLPTPTTANHTSDKAKRRRPTSGPSRGGPSFGLADIIEEMA